MTCSTVRRMGRVPIARRDQRKGRPSVTGIAVSLNLWSGSGGSRPGEGGHEFGQVEGELVAGEGVDLGLDGWRAGARARDDQRRRWSAAGSSRAARISAGLHCRRAPKIASVLLTPSGAIWSATKFRQSRRTSSDMKGSQSGRARRR